MIDAIYPSFGWCGGNKIKKAITVANMAVAIGRQGELSSPTDTPMLVVGPLFIATLYFLTSQQLSPLPEV
ncbi:MAG: hypothetical protein C0507_12675 [Cyanobacteria bacterium PR.3.49]|jgi:hypothetical protein|nr:hypothetical protein [Cyanobacteria bacterium PR.3.49]